MQSDPVHPCPLSTELVQALPPDCQLLISGSTSSPGQEEVLECPCLWLTSGKLGDFGKEYHPE